MDKVPVYRAGSSGACGLSSAHYRGSISDTKEKWVWNDERNSLFAVKDTRKWLVEDGSREGNNMFTWCKWIPKKCNIFMWRASMDRIPTLAALRRNIVVGEGGCYFCGEDTESTDHIFTACRIANGVWAGVASWCRVPPPFFFSIQDVHNFVNHMSGSKTKKDIVNGVFILTAWRIWKARNEKAFASIEANVVHLV
ncbi:putative reverse transcriptase zinc-binding domain-containing protein [Helianthus annuus]|nr:putative reverse transcriptase zinc-binding domain-containing protein [Helianthus annuus]